MPDVFISYSSDERKRALLLWRALRGQGLVTFLDKAPAGPGLRSGSSWKAQLRANVEQSPAMVCLVSPRWLRRKECRKEYEQAASYKSEKKIFVYVIGKPSKRKLDDQFGEAQRDPFPDQPHGLHKLAEYIASAVKALPRSPYPQWEGLRSPEPTICKLVLPSGDDKTAPSLERKLRASARQPSWDEVWAGSYLKRPNIIAPAWSAFSEWLEAEREDSHRIPVFWLSGRPGDGKSILMRQVLCNHIQNPPRAVVAECRLSQTAQAVSYLDTSRRPGMPVSLLVVEDPQLASDEGDDRWEEALDTRALSGFSNVAIVACGPSAGLADVRTRFPILDITNYEVPPLIDNDRRELASWFGVPATSDSDSIVQVVQDLTGAHFVNRGDLKKLRKKYHKTDHRLPLIAEQILAVNALGISPPLNVLIDKNPIPRRVENQLSFRFQILRRGDTALARYGHANISWPAFANWPRDAECNPFDEFLDRIHEVLTRAIGQNLHVFVDQILQAIRQVDPTTVERAIPGAAIENAYRELRERCPQDTDLEALLHIHILSRALQAGEPADVLLELEQRAVRLAIAPPISAAIRARLMGQLMMRWVTARKMEILPADLFNAFLADHTGPHLGRQLASLATGIPAEAGPHIQLAEAWLKKFGSLASARPTWDSYIGRKGDGLSEDFLMPALAWIAANGGIADSVVDRVTEAVGHRADVAEAIAVWSERHPEKIEPTSRAFATLMAKQPRNSGLRERALRYFHQRPDAASQSDLLVQLIKSCPANSRADMMDAARTWMLRNADSERGITVIETFVGSDFPKDMLEEILTSSLPFVAANPDSPASRRLLCAILRRAAIRSGVFEATEAWIARTGTLAEAGEVLFAYLTARIAARTECPAGALETAKAWLAAYSGQQLQIARRFGPLIRSAVAILEQDETTLRNLLEEARQIKSATDVCERLKILAWRFHSDARFWDVARQFLRVRRGRGMLTLWLQVVRNWLAIGLTPIPATPVEISRMAGTVLRVLEEYHFIQSVLPLGAVEVRGTIARILVRRLSSAFAVMSLDTLPREAFDELAHLLREGLKGRAEAAIAAVDRLSSWPTNASDIIWSGVIDSDCRWDQIFATLETWLGQGPPRRPANINFTKGALQRRLRREPEIAATLGPSSKMVMQRGGR